MALRCVCGGGATASDDGITRMCSHDSTMDVVFDVVEAPLHGPACVVWDASIVLAQVLLDLAASGALAVTLGRTRAIEIGAGVAGLPGLLLHRLGAAVLLTDTPSAVGLLQHNADLAAAVPPLLLDGTAPCRPHPLPTSASVAANPVSTDGCVVDGDGGCSERSSDCSDSGRATVTCSDSRPIPRLLVSPFLFGGAVKRLRPHVVPFDIVVASDVLGCGDAGAFPDLVKSFNELAGPCTRVFMSYRYRADFEAAFFTALAATFELSIVAQRSAADCGFVMTDVCPSPVVVFEMRKRGGDSAAAAAPSLR